MQETEARAERILAISDRMLDRLEEMLEGIGEKDAGTLKQLAGALKDIRELQNRAEQSSAVEEERTGVILIGSLPEEPGEGRNG